MPVGGSGGGGGGASAKGVRAGRAFVEIGGDESGLVRALNSAKTRVMGLASSLAVVGRGTLLAGGALLSPIAAFAGPLTSFITTGVDRAAEIKDIAEIFGTTAEAASRMAFAFEVAGGGIDEVTKSLNKVAEMAARDGLTLDAALLKVADDLLAIEDAAERVAAAQKIFGDRFAAKFLDVAGDLRELMAEAPIVTAEMAKNAERIQQAWRKAGIALKTAMVPVVESLVPLVQGMAAFIKENFQFIKVGAAAAATLVALGVAASALSAVFGTLGVALNASLIVLGLVPAAVGAAVGTFKTLLALTLILLNPFKMLPVLIGAASAAAGGLGIALMLISSPISLIAVGLGAVAAAVGFARAEFGELADFLGGVDWFATLRESFRGTAEEFKNTVAAMVAVFKRGDFEAAAAIAATGLELVWTETILFLKAKWIDFRDFFVELWHDAVDFVAKDIAAFFDTVRDAFDDVAGWAAGEPPGGGGELAAAVKADAVAARAERGRARGGELAGLMAERDRILKRLRELNRRAMVEPGAVAGERDVGAELRKHELMKLADSVKGAFTLAGTGRLRFGFGDTIAKEQLDRLKGIDENTKKMAAELVALHNALRLG